MKLQCQWDENGGGEREEEEDVQDDIISVVGGHTSSRECGREMWKIAHPPINDV